MSSNIEGERNWNTEGSQTLTEAVEFSVEDWLHQQYVSQIISMEGVSEVYASFDEESPITDYWIIIADENPELRRRIYRLDYELFTPDLPYKINTRVYAKEDLLTEGFGEGAVLIYSIESE